MELLATVTQEDGAGFIVYGLGFGLAVGLVIALFGLALRERG